MVSKKQIESLASRLTAQQKQFADNILFLNMSKNEAALDAYNTENNKYLKNFVQNLMNNEKIVDYMTAVRQNMEESLLIDRYYIIRNLKKLAETGNENTQLKAIIELGKIRGMYVDKQENTTTESPSEIMRKSFEKTLKIHKEEENEPESEVI